MKPTVLPRRNSQISRLLLLPGVALLIVCWTPLARATAWQDLWQGSARFHARAVAAGLAQESPEGTEESTTAQFKHSASVRIISRLTGLGLESSYWLAMAINFAIILGLIVWATKKNVLTMFRSRNALILKAMDEARQASEEAKRRVREVESRLSKLDAELEAMRAAAEKETLAEEQRIQAAAEEDIRRIVEAAEQEIAAAVRSARRELKGYAADLAVSLAQKQIHVDSATDEEMVHNFAQQLSTEDHHGRQ
jgi:F-type H+-transporting ATPase subunit b